MNSLIIKQNDSSIEQNVPAGVVYKLRQIAEAIPNAIELEGTININGGVYLDDVDFFQVDHAADFPNFHITALKYYIKIADPSINQTLADWKGDGTGLTATQAASITTLQVGGQSIFKNNTNLTDATFFKYFTGLSMALNNSNQVDSISDAFQGCTNLTTVTLPSSITKIPTYMFNNCSSLSLLSVENVQEINTGAFVGCNILLTNTQNVLKIIGYNGSNRGSLGINNQMLSFPSITEITGDYSFNGCSALTTLDLGEHITTISSSRTFYGCSGLRTIIIRSAEPPTLYQSNTNWGVVGMNLSLNSNCKIYVNNPSAYTSDSTWNQLGSSRFVDINTLLS